jgi:hypothetical protein
MGLSKEGRREGVCGGMKRHAELKLLKNAAAE